MHRAIVIGPGNIEESDLPAPYQVHIQLLFVVCKVIGNTYKRHTAILSRLSFGRRLRPAHALVTSAQKALYRIGPARLRVVVLFGCYAATAPGSSGARCESLLLAPPTNCCSPTVTEAFSPSTFPIATMSHTGTFRGTPKNRNNAQAQAAQFANSPSAIPRPAFETHASQSDAGTSTMSASRQKMSKRDEVRC